MSMQKLTLFAIIIIIIGAVADVATTQYCLSFGPDIFYEQNPLFYTLGHFWFLVFYIFSSFFMVGLTLLAEKFYLKKGFRNYGALITSFFGFFHLFLAYNNYLLVVIYT
jgi:hypothetical protein